jgi:hypothetical protein
MRYRLGSACCLLLWALVAGHGAEKKTPEFTWTGRWEKTDLVAAYHSYIKMEDGRIACFENVGDTALNVAFTREPGNLLTWTPYAQLMAFDAIFDLPDPTDPKKPAANRFMTRPTVVRLPGGNFLGLGVICRGYPAVDGLNYVVSYTGTAESVNVVEKALLAGREAPTSAMWKYQGKVRGPVGEYLAKQIPRTTYTDVGNLIFLPDGPAKPDHARPTHNRFLLFANYLGSPEPKVNAWEWTVLCYSADGREWFFAKDSAGAVRNLTPLYGSKKGYLFPFVFRHAADEWWMWRSGDIQGEEKFENKSCGVHEIYLYYSPDGLNWRLLRTDVSWKDLPGTDGKPLGLKNMTIYYDAEKKQIHGMLSVRSENGDTWFCKYHNVARVTGK